MIEQIFEKPPSDRVRRYLEFAEQAAQRAAAASGQQKRRYQKLSVEWRGLAAAVNRPQKTSAIGHSS